MADTISQQVSQESVADIRLLLRDLKKMIRVLAIYPADNPLPAKMRASFSGRFVEVVDKVGGFCLSIRPNEIVYASEAVFQDKGAEETLAAPFYNAGIIHLEFRPGLTVDEVNTFLDIVKECPITGGGDFDLATGLWQKQLNSIRFKTVEDLSLGESDAEVVIRDLHPDFGADSVGSGVDYNQVILEEGDESTSGTHSTTLSPEAVEDGRQMGLSLEEPAEPSRTAEILLAACAIDENEEKEQIRRLVEENKQFDQYRTVTQVLVEILHFWDELSLFSETVSICDAVLDQMLAKGAFAPAADLMHALRGMRDNMTAPKPLYAEQLTAFLRGAGDVKRIQRLTEIINGQEIVDAKAVETYLDCLGWESLTHIIAMLGNLVSRNARLTVCNFLAGRGRQHLAIIGSGVRDKRWYVVRNTIMILGQIGGDQILEYLASAATHADRRVRQEAITALTRMESERAVNLLCRCLEDPDPDLRIFCLDHLGSVKGRQVFEKIRDVVMSDAFADRPIEEQEQFLIAYSRLGGAEATGYFDSLLNSFKVFSSARDTSRRLLGLKALAYNTSEEAERLILQATRSHRQWLREAAAAALDLRRKNIYRGSDHGSARNA
jgi:hypothetical protein